jgi:hypothetical protein
MPQLRLARVGFSMKSSLFFLWFEWQIGHVVLRCCGTAWSQKTNIIFNLFDYSVRHDALQFHVVNIGV